MTGKTNKPMIMLMLAFLPFAMARAGQEYVTASPGGELVITATFSGGSLCYSLAAAGKELISASPLGLDFGRRGALPGAGWRITAVRRRRTDKVWTPLWGKSARAVDRYNQTTIEMEGDGPLHRLDIIIRAYDDGVAFRYVVPRQAPDTALSCRGELTRFDFAGNYTAWFYHGEHANLGPDSIRQIAGDREPVMTVKAGARDFMAVLEADLRSGSPLVLQTQKGGTAFSVVSSPGMVGPGYRSSWRVILYGRTPGRLVDSHLVQLLNPPAAPGIDFSWVKPGVAVWDWRIRGAHVDGFVYGGNYASWVRMVDFASRHGIPYLLLDAGWYGPEFKKTSDPLKGGKVKDVIRLIAYGRAKGVRILLYLNDVGGRRYPLDTMLRQFGAWGVAGVKYGFMRGSMADKNLRTRMITALCARYHLLCDFHDGPVIPYGQLRTFPNAVTREYCEAQLDARRVFQPETFVTSVFVNMLAGPIDMNNGTFDLGGGKTDRLDNNEAVPSTLVSEAARTLIVFSGLTVIPGVPEFYEKYPVLFSFIASEKMPWRQSRTLMGKIGAYIVMARQASDGTWLVGAATDATARTLEIPLDFLGKGRYAATIIRDGKDARYDGDRLSHTVQKRTVRSAEKVKVRLAPGGGACLIIRKR
jgi:alpha-glucosidase